MRIFLILLFLATPLWGQSSISLMDTTQVERDVYFSNVYHDYFKQRDEYERQKFKRAQVQLDVQKARDESSAGVPTSHPLAGLPAVKNIQKRSPEATFVDLLAEKYDAQQEVVLWDGTRADLVGDDWVAEVDFEEKWAEAIGQSLYYAKATGKKPVVILLVKKSNSPSRFAYRAQTVCNAVKGLRLVIHKY